MSKIARMKQLRSQVIRDQEHGTCPKEPFYYGPDLTFERCQVTFNTPASRLILNGVIFRQCELTVRRDLRNFHGFCSARLEGCTVRGRLRGCDFGHWPDAYGPAGGLEGGDFEKALLDGCRFVGCSLEGVRLPGWPHITLCHPERHHGVLKELPWPGRSGFALVCEPEDLPPLTAAIVWNVPDLAHWAQCGQDELRECLERLRDRQPESVRW